MNFRLILVFVLHVYVAAWWEQTSTDSTEASLMVPHLFTISPLIITYNKCILSYSTIYFSSGSKETCGSTYTVHTEHFTSQHFTTVGHTQRQTTIHTVIKLVTSLHVFKLWEETEKPGENPRSQRRNIQPANWWFYRQSESGLTTSATCGSFHRLILTSLFLLFPLKA